MKFLTAEKHCDPMSQNIHNNTALHSAVWSGRLGLVKFLIEELKCPPDIPGTFNLTPLQMALRWNHYNIAQFLQKHSVVPYIYVAMAICMTRQLGPSE